MTINIIKTLKALCPVAVCSLLAASCTGNFEELNTHPTDLDPDIMSSTERVGTLLPTLTYLLAPQQENQSQMIDQIIFGQLGGYYSCGNNWEGVNIATLFLTQRLTEAHLRFRMTASKIFILK